MKTKVLLFLALYSLGMFLSLNMNSKYRIHTYKCTMWADATGYYVYLPATFIYHWDFDKIPKGMDTLTGYGFALDTSQKVLRTKYTSGIAYLQLPFFCIAHLYCKMTGTPANGFTQPYVNSLLFSGVFYMLMGLFLLFSILRKHFQFSVSLITTIIFPLCTNLYFYGIEHTGLTHVYTFFLSTFILYNLQNYSPGKLLLIIPACALIFLNRPTNMILLGMIMAYLACTRNMEWFRRLPVKWVASGIILGILVIIPQLFYWKYMSGSWITYSYKDEGFIYWNNPKILEVLFAACNGFLTYAPVLIFAFWGLLMKPVSKAFSLALFLLIGLLIYTNASWWCWSFGCAYGGRAFIDYYLFFAIPLAALVNYIFTRSKIIRISFLSLCFLLMAYNILFIYGYDDCWYSTTWDYRYILKVLKG